MSHPDQFARAEILARCLEAIQSGEMTVEQCAAHYPDVSGLAESLRIALSLRHVESDQVAFPDVRKQALERRLLQVMDQRWSQKSTATTALRVLRPLATAAALIVVISAMLLGLARVSRSALPGDTLYGYKRFVESTELSFASAAAKPDLLRSMAELRLDELNMVIVRDHRVDVALLRDVAHSVNEAIAAQPESAQNRLLYDRAQQVFAFAASEGVTDATAVASTISTPVPQPTALISVGTATSTAVQVSVTPTGSPTSAASTFTATATVTSTMTPSATITVAPSLTVTSTSTLHRVILITATSLPT
ncbi:MAG: hypothetical protein KF726_13185, partial [Anaerolineae bacterium]|nr:hypothetical protein [Anaerolineae bacterium]